MNRKAVPKQSPRRIGAAAAFIEDKLELGHVAFSKDELVRETGLTPTAANFQLRRLGDRVLQTSARQAFYLIVGPEHRIVGAPPPALWLDDYFKWLERPYYLALQSAAGCYGSNSQAVQITQVITNRPWRALILGRLEIRFYVKQGMEQIPVNELERAVAPLRVSKPETTMFDLIVYANQIGGIGRAAETIAPLLPQISITGLKEALKRENRVGAAQRLGFLLETMNETKLAAVVMDWLPSTLKVVRLSTGTRMNKNRIDKHWKVLRTSEEFK